MAFQRKVKSTLTGEVGIVVRSKEGFNGVAMFEMVRVGGNVWDRTYFYSEPRYLEFI